MDTHGQELAETFVKMVNTHDPDLVDQFIAEDYINHNAVVADGREANRQFWHAFFAALPDVWRIEDGLFAEHWDELNYPQVYQQMGALPPLGGSGAQP
jgi:predicted SnoaL-like aldol condensation-catalyzing enzyme